MALCDYKRDKVAMEEGIEVEVGKGVKARLLEFGTPGFWEAYIMFLGDDMSAELSKEKDREATEDALIHYIILSITDEDGTVIEDKDEIAEIIHDPAMWELKKDILAKARDEKLFVAKKEAQAKAKKH